MGRHWGLRLSRWTLLLVLCSGAVPHFACSPRLTRLPSLSLEALRTEFIRQGPRHETPTPGSQHPLRHIDAPRAR